MEALDIARWQFGVTTVYHFIFVPLTIGLAPLVAIMQSIWYVKKTDRWLRLTKFFGKLFMINFALGVVTGIVQEFQFGMNWSNYSRFVGDIFGAPLAMEGLAAFFIESTFLGLWIFGWDRLSKKVHLATIWLVAIGVNLSAVFIIGANSFMQHPVGAELNTTTGRAELTSIGDVLTNPTLLAALPHVILAAFLTAGTFIAGIAGWQLVRHARKGSDAEARDVYRPAVQFGLVVIVIAGIGVALTGDIQGKLLYEEQPMKMSSAEAVCGPEDGGTAFSVLSTGLMSNNCADVNHVIEVPGLASWLATGDKDKALSSVDSLNAAYRLEYGATVKEYMQKAGANPEAIAAAPDTELDYKPMMVINYWSFRLMIGFAAFSALLAVAGLWVTRGGRTTTSGLFKWISLIAIPAPFLASAFGWIFTEMGRQPWIVVPNITTTGMSPDLRMLTADGVSGSGAIGVSGYSGSMSVVISLITFTLLYGVLAVAWFYLMQKFAKAGAPEIVKAPKESDDAPLTFAY